MVSTTDIHNAVAQVLKKKTGLKTYSNEVLEGFTRPCFFCKVSFDAVPANLHTDRILATVALNYIPSGQKRVRDEKDGLQMLTLLRSIFRGSLKVGDRYLFIQRAEGDFAGENYDIAVFTITLDFFDEAVRVQEDTRPLEYVDFSNDIIMHIQKE